MEAPSTPSQASNPAGDPNLTPAQLRSALKERDDDIEQLKRSKQLLMEQVKELRVKYESPVAKRHAPINKLVSGLSTANNNSQRRLFAVGKQDDKLDQGKLIGHKELRLVFEKACANTQISYTR